MLDDSVDYYQYDISALFMQENVCTLRNAGWSI